MTDPLLTLLDSPDPDVRTQGVELARALGSEATDRVLASCETGPDGRLWRPLGLSDALLSLLLDAPPADLAGIRQLTLCGRIDPELLARIARCIPGLTSLTLSSTNLEDLSALTRFTRLRSLSILRSTVDDLSPLTKLGALRHLSLAHCRVLKIGAIRRLSCLTSLSLDNIEAPSVDLPPRLTTLNVCRFHSTIRNFEALPLRVLTLNSGQLEYARALLPRLSELRLLGTTSVESLAGLPVTKLDLHATAGAAALPPILALPRLHTLRLVERYSDRTELSLAPLHAHPTLSVVSLPIQDDPAFTDYGARWVPDVGLTRWLLSDYYRTTSHPQKVPALLSRAAAHWREEGHHHRLDLVEVDRKRKIRAIKALRAQVAISLKEAKELFDVLLSGGLTCLTLDEAVELQGWLFMSGMPARISRWTA